MGAALFSLTLLFALSAAANPPLQASAPAMDCSTVQMGLADCLSFVTATNNKTGPSKSCCDGLRDALKPDPAAGAKCLCQGFEQSGSYGIKLNISNAMDLPRRCGVSNFSVEKQCQLGPAAAPGSAAAPGPAAATPGSRLGVPPSASLVPGTPPSPSLVPGTPPIASSVPGTPPGASPVPGTPSGADAVSPNVAPSSPGSSMSSRLGASVELLVCTTIFAVFRTWFS